MRKKLGSGYKNKCQIRTQNPVKAALVKVTNKIKHSIDLQFMNPRKLRGGSHELEQQASFQAGMKVIGPLDKELESPNISLVSELKGMHQPSVSAATFPGVMSGVRVDSAGGKNIVKYRL